MIAWLMWETSAPGKNWRKTQKGRRASTHSIQFSLKLSWCVEDDVFYELCKFQSEIMISELMAIF